MRQITSAETLAEVLATPARWGCAAGLLPADVAPPETVLWFRPLTVDDARAAAFRAMRDVGKDATDTDANCGILAAGVYLADTDEPTEADLVPVWSSAAEAAEFGDPSVVGSVSNDLMVALVSATGFAAAPGDAGGAGDAASVRARLRHRGRWVAGLFQADPEAAVWVRGVTEGERRQAAEGSRMPVGGDAWAHNPIEFLRVLLSFAVRTGPGGPPLLTVNDAGRLPFGAARALDLALTELTMGVVGSAVPAIRFRDLRDAAVAEGAGGATSVVGGREVGDGTGDA
jgi:hypothetical protein